LSHKRAELPPLTPMSFAALLAIPLPPFPHSIFKQEALPTFWTLAPWHPSCSTSTRLLGPPPKAQRRLLLVPFFESANDVPVFGTINGCPRKTRKLPFVFLHIICFWLCLPPNTFLPTIPDCHQEARARRHRLIVPLTCSRRGKGPYPTGFVIKLSVLSSHRRFMYIPRSPTFPLTMFPVVGQTRANLSRLVFSPLRESSFFFLPDTTTLGTSQSLTTPKQKTYKNSAVPPDNS